MKQSILAQLRAVSHAEIKAPAVAGLVLFNEINSRRLVVCEHVETDPRRNAELIANATPLIKSGYAMQDAIHAPDDEAFPELIRVFAASLMVRRIMAKTPISFRNQPAGCRFGGNPVGKIMPVFLDDMAAIGSRAPRRWAQKQLLRKAGKK